MLEDRIGILGLWVDSNAGLAPVGALLRANETTLGAGGLLRPDRGLPRLDDYGASGDRAKLMSVFNGTPISVWTLASGGSQVITYWDGSAWQTVPARAAASPLALGTRPQLMVIGETLYITSSNGLKMVDRLDKDALTSGQGDWGAQRSAGVPRATNILGGPAGTSGIMTADTAVAYRTVLGFTDANGRVHLGAPSERTVIINPPAASVAIGSLARTGGTTVTATTTTKHGFSPGQTVTVSPGEGNFPAGNKVITSVTDLTFRYTEAGANAVSVAVETFTPTDANPSITIQWSGYDAANVSGQATFGYWFVQVYRTKTTASASDEPGDDMRLAYEHIWTNTDVAGLPYAQFTFSDDVGNGALADALYTNRYEEGIANANDPPPLANAVGAFRDHAFYGDVKRKQQIVLTLQAVGAPGGIQVGDQIRIAGKAFEGRTSEVLGSSFFEVHTGGTISQNIEATARSLVRVINEGGLGAQYAPLFNAQYISGPDDTPGRILIEETGLGGESFAESDALGVDAMAIYADNGGALTTGTPRGAAFTPALPDAYVASAVARVGTTVTVTTTVNHPFIVGSIIWLGHIQPDNGTDSTFARGWKTVTGVPAANQITYTDTVSGAATAGTPSSFTLSTRRANEIYGNDSAAKNAVEISKFGEHDAVPQGNRWLLGSSDARVLAFAELANQWYVFKEDGVWRLIGTTVDDFDFEPAFPSYRLLGRDTLRRLGDVLFGLTDQGVIPITPGGMGAPISPPVNSLLPMRSADDRTFLATRAWAYANPGDQQYVLYALASAGTAGAPDPTGALIWNAAGGGWTTTTRHPLAAGFVDQATGYLYAAEAGTNWTRRDLRVGNPNDGWAALDYHDGSAAVTINSISGTALVLASDPLINGAAVRAGDVLLQGGVYFRISSGSGTTPTVEDATGLTTGAATLYRGYASVVQWIRFMGEDPGLHQFQEISLQFGESGFGDAIQVTQDTSLPTYGPGYLTFATAAQALNGEYTYFQGLPGYGSIQSPVRPMDVRMAIPDSYQRADWISPYVSIQVALARWQLDGYTMKHRFISSRVE